MKNLNVRTLMRIELMLFAFYMILAIATIAAPSRFDMLGWVCAGINLYWLRKWRKQALAESAPS